MHGIEDYETSKKVSDMMNEKSTIFNYEASIEEKINCIKNSKLMIGMRLHALIFAAISNTPMIGISYDPKIDSFLEIVNQPLIGSVYKEWDFNDLYKTSMNIIDNLGENIEILKNNCKTLKENALNTSKLAIELFEKE
jgi:polysaccharide pyruvyl transferase WcaK-like protein